MSLVNKEEAKKVENKIESKTFDPFDLSYFSPSTLNKMPWLE